MTPAITKQTVSGAERPENFPVASVLLRRSDRQVVMAFYNFARFADDIADAPHLSVADKIDALNILDDALHGLGTESQLVDISSAVMLRAKLVERGLSVKNASDLLIAFRQDAENTNTETWEALLDYCQYSANPVGRFLLELHNEPKAAIEASDALCTALQILNHIQDIGEDFKTRHRRYIPLYWPNGPHAETKDLTHQASSEQLRACIDQALDRTEILLKQASLLPQKSQCRRLRAESVAILDLAYALLRALRHNDPLTTRIRPNKTDAWNAAKSAVKSLFWETDQTLLTPNARQTVSQIVDASGSSFRHGMRSLPTSRREAMYTIYAFCRVIDDIADDDGLPQDDRLQALQNWEQILKAIEQGHRPNVQTPLIEAMIDVHARFGLDIEECQALITGMKTDVLGPVIRPSEDEFVLYCRRVAVSVGLLCLPIMGATDTHAKTFAHELGHALQCVNIVRDVAEDAALGRCYLPHELLEEFGITNLSPDAIVAHPNIGKARAIIAARARMHFRNAHAALTEYNYEALRPARLMMVGYRDVLDRIEAAGFDKLSKPNKLPKWKKLFLLAKLPKPLANRDKS